MAEENNKPMTLEEAIQNFISNHNKKRELICNGHYSKYDDSHTEGAFDEIIDVLLSGHIEVRQGDSIIRSIKPTCIEIYYHEEDDILIPKEKLSKEKSSDTIEAYKKIADDIYKSLNAVNHGLSLDTKLLIPDFIVYHRNKPFHNEDLFPEQGVLNNHQSGIDIAFEFPISLNERKINVRASALIRGFVATNGKLPSIEKQKELEIEDRSTYIYDQLYPFTPITGQGMQIIWMDDESQNELKIRAIPRKNVFQYEMDDTWIKETSERSYSQRRKSLDFATKSESGKSNDGKPIYIPDERPLRFYNFIFYNHVEPK